ncbi:MAG TPA: uracil-DNA glycosylase family protein [Longimicrobium sp.]|nr:uracil-DNA glycosylase family protein [Longimicrobium sp.]
MSDPRDLLRSYLRQRAELGDAELVLDRHTAGEVRTLLSPAPAARLARPADAPAQPRPAARPDATAREPVSADVPPARREATPAEVPSLETHVRAGAAPPGATPMRPSPSAPTRGISAEEIRALPVLDAVREVSLGCPRCGLAKTRTRVVFGEGNPNADLMVVGEAPGENEDRQGRPFVGKAGKLLDLLLMTVGFPRESVYICNVLKCRPPGNRNPQPDEVEACSPYLLKQVELVQPRIIVAFGTFAAQTLLATDVSIGRLRGKLHQYQGIPLVPTYHPAALLRNQGWVRAVWEDLQRARQVLDRSS